MRFYDSIFQIMKDKISDDRKEYFFSKKFQMFETYKKYSVFKQIYDFLDDPKPDAKQY